MAQIIKELRVDVSQPNVFQAIVAKQHDSNSRFLKITLVDFGVKVEVPNTAKVTINANRPDGASESFKGEANNDGTITVPLAQWMLDIDGEVKCDVSVTNTEDNKRLTSTDFWLEVQKAANPNASIPLDPDGEILIIKPVTEINENSKDTDYPSAKAVYDLDNITATASGSAITIDSAKAPLQNLKLYGNTEQNGTPTPSAPVPFVSVGDSGSFEVGVYGKNLLNANQSYFVDIPQHLFPNYLPILLRANTTYTFSLKSTVSGETQLDLYNKENVKVYSALINLLANQSSVYAFTPKEDVYSLRFYVNISNVTLTNLQIEQGTQATPYEPCNKQSMDVLHTLRSVGDVKDEIDFARGVLAQRCYLATDFSYNFELENVVVYRASKPYPIDYANAMCSHTNVNVNSNDDNTHFYIGSSAIWAYLPKDADVSNLQVLCKLETPQEIPLTETELNAYRQLYTNKGTTTILSEAEAEVDYYINKPNAQAIGLLHEQINKDYFKLQQAIITTGGSTL